MEIKLAGPHTAASAAVVTHILPLCSPLLSSLSHTHTHILCFLSLSHTHIGELVQLPCSASSAAAARRNEWLLRTLTFITGGSCKNWFQPINEEVSRTRAVSSLAEIWGGWLQRGGHSVRRPILGNPLQAYYYPPSPPLPLSHTHTLKEEKKKDARGCRECPRIANQWPIPRLELVINH